MSNPSKQKGTASLRERLYSRIKITPNGCWEFTGYRSAGGYGELGRGRRGEGNIRAHRAAWELEHGPIPTGMSVCHACDNPPCCNPDHLFLGTHRANMRDMTSKGRGAGADGGQNARAKLTRQQIEDIRVQYVRDYRVGRGGTRSNASELAIEFGITPQYVSQIVRGLWRKTA